MPTDVLPFIFALFAFAAFVHGFTGFAFGIVSVSVLALTTIDLESGAAAIMLQSLFVTSCVLVLTSRRDPIHWRLIGLLAVGSLIGLPVGYWVLQSFKDLTGFRIVIGLAVAGFGLHGLLPQKRLRLHRWWGLPLGIMSGCISGAMVSGGPPIIFYLYGQVDDQREMKPTAQTIFMMVTGMRVAVTTIQGSVMNSRLLVTTAMLMPVTIIALLCGHRLAKRVSAGSFRRTTFGFLIVIGLLAAARATIASLQSGT